MKMHIDNYIKDENFFIKSSEQFKKSKLDLTIFKSPEETFLLYLGIKKASELIKNNRKTHKSLHCLDLGCGSSLPGLFALRNNHIENLTGIDIDPHALIISGENSNKLSIDYQSHTSDENIEDRENFREAFTLILGDINQKNVLKKSGSIDADILSANLPYLPSDTQFDHTVNAGNEGIDFVPDAIFQYARENNAEAITFNFSSLGYPDTIWKKIYAHNEYSVQHVFLQICPFGHYTNQIINTIKNSWKESYFSTRNQVHFQMIYNVVMKKSQAETIQLSEIKNIQNIFKCSRIDKTWKKLYANHSISPYFLDKNTFDKIYDNFGLETT